MPFLLFKSCFVCFKGRMGNGACPDSPLCLMNLVLHMCFERFLLAFESRDLSQADKRITRLSSFPSFNF